MLMTNDKIKLKQFEIGAEKDPIHKQELQIQLKKMQLELEIEQIKDRIKQLG